MEQDVGLVLRTELWGVASLTVGGIGVAGLGVVDDVGSQHGDLRHTLLRRLIFSDSSLRRAVAATVFSASTL